MNRIDEYEAKERCQFIGYALLILPSVALGVLAMIFSGISPAFWGQQVAAWVVLALFAQPLHHVAKCLPVSAWSVFLLIPLAATLFGEEIEGVRRWLDLGVVNVNTAMLVLPALLAMLHRTKHPFPTLLAAAAILSLQPDLSQLAAFSAAALPLLWRHRKERLWVSASVLALAMLVTRCLLLPTAVEPVSYCEGILSMLGDISPLLKAAGVAALAAIPAFFGARFLHLKQPQSLSLTAYYAVTILFIFSGEYPVPFIGFGLSPIAGYGLAYICSAPSSMPSRECQHASLL